METHRATESSAAAKCRRRRLPRPWPLQSPQNACPRPPRPARHRHLPPWRMPRWRPYGLTVRSLGHGYRLRSHLRRSTQTRLPSIRFTTPVPRNPRSKAALAPQSVVPPDHLDASSGATVASFDAAIDRPIPADLRHRGDVAGRHLVANTQRANFTLHQIAQSVNNIVDELPRLTVHLFYLRSTPKIKSYIMEIKTIYVYISPQSSIHGVVPHFIPFNLLLSCAK